jgi:thiol-disulfide isomerase/thioredoxin
MFRKISGLAVLLMILFACSNKQKNQSGDSEFIDKIKLSDMSGQSIDLKQFKGKVVFINVWATWCKPCIEEMPTIKQAQTLLAGKDIEFLFASNEDKERIESFAERRKLDLRFVMLENLEELQIQALPLTYVINREGELVFSEPGYRKWDDSSNIELLNKIIDATN